MRRRFWRQLRAEKSGKPVAAVYGVLYGYPGPLPNILVRLRSVGKSYEARTDEQGAYGLSPASSGDLPGFRGVAAQPGPRAEHTEWCAGRLSCLVGSCSENDLYALRTGRIAGRVFGPDGKVCMTPVWSCIAPASTTLGRKAAMAINMYMGLRGSRAPSSSPTLPADDYVLVFYRRNVIDSHNPSPGTFYPNASSLGGALLLHLSDGQQDRKR